MHRKRDEFNEVGFGAVCLFRGNREWPAFFEEQLRDVLESAGNHETCIRKIEALRHCSREVQRFSDHHLAGYFRQIESDVVPKHALMIIQGGQPEEANGGRDRTRTCDLLRVKQAL